MIGHFVRDPRGKNGQNDKNGPGGPEFVSAKKRYLSGYVFIMP